MFVLANLVTTIAGLLSLLINLYTFVVIISALFTWVNPDPYNKFVIIMRSLTEPVYRLIYKTFPFVRTGTIDFAPVILLVLLQLLNGVVVQSLQQIGLRMTGI